MGVVVFDFSVWSARYPEFPSVTLTQANAYFTEATLYCDNSDASRILDLGQRGALLNMLVAHIAKLNTGDDSDDEGASSLVGRISSASEGSVSVSVDLGGAPGSAYWFAQTKYGLAYFQATARYRRMRYRPGPQRFFSGYGAQSDPNWLG